jgi:hypothetical protein
MDRHFWKARRTMNVAPGLTRRNKLFSHCQLEYDAQGKNSARWIPPVYFSNFAKCGMRIACSARIIFQWRKSAKCIGARAAASRKNSNASNR